MLLRRWGAGLRQGSSAYTVAQREIAARMHRLALHWDEYMQPAGRTAGSSRQALRVFEVISGHYQEIDTVQDIADRVGR